MELSRYQIQLKLDSDFEKRMARLKNQNSKQEEPKPTRSEPPRASNKESATPSDNKTTKTPPPATMPAMADLNRDQIALLETAAAEYKKVTRQEFQSLFTKGREMGKAKGFTKAPKVFLWPIWGVLWQGERGLPIPG